MHLYLCLKTPPLSEVDHAGKNHLDTGEVDFQGFTQIQHINQMKKVAAHMNEQHCVWGMLYSLALTHITLSIHHHC